MNIYHQEIPCNIPYTYHLIWLDPITKIPTMKYYGVRYARDCNPTDLWVTYFTSSRYVTEYVNNFGDPDIIEIRRVFTDNDRIQKAIDWEKKVLVRMKAHIRNDYINKHAGAAINYSDPEVIARREYVNSLAVTKQNRKYAAIKRENNESIKQKRIKACNTPEAKEKRNKTRIQNFDNSIEAKTARSMRSKEINNRPEILEANRKRYLGVTWEERIGDEAAKEYKKKMSDLRKSNAWNPSSGIKKGKDSPNSDKTVYTWENTRTKEQVKMTGIEFSKYYNLDNANVRRAIKNFGKLSSRGKPYSVKDWIVLAK